MMSNRLQSLVRAARESLSYEEIAAKASPCSATTVRNADEGKKIGPKLSYRIALACGASEKDARSIAEDGLFTAKRG